MKLRLTVMSACVLLALSIAPRAHASDRDPAAASTLFEKGRAEAQSHDYAAACLDFAESHRLDPKVGTLLNLADCEERTGKRGAAYASWQQAADLAQAQSDPRATYARERISQLEAHIARLAVRLAPGAPANAVVTRDGIALGAPSLGVALPIDAGAHVVTVNAVGFEAKIFTITLDEGKSGELVVTSGAALPPDAPKPRVEEAAPPTTFGPQRKIAVGVGVLGIVAAAVGGTLAIAAKSKADSADCNSANICSAAGVKDRHNAVGLGNAASFVLIGGGVAFAAGVTLWLTGKPDARASTTSVGAFVGPSSVGVVGRF